MIVKNFGVSTIYNAKCLLHLVILRKPLFLSLYHRYNQSLQRKERDVKRT